MDFADKVAALSQRIIKQKGTVETEEATKNAFIMPFLSALGFDVFDPNVVVPEFTADVGVKKGEKVDYAIKIDGKIALLVECKSCKSALSDNHMSQLFRYFSVTDARFGILTNGVAYRFFTDLEQPNKMDSRPFFEFDMGNYRPAQVEELKKFAIGNFDVGVIFEAASDLKYGSLLMREIAAEVDNPSDEVARLLVSRVYDGKITANVLGKFRPLVQKAMRDTMRELVNQRLSIAMDETAKTALPIAPQESASIALEAGQSESTATVDDIVTTQEEIDGFQIVRAIVREVVRVDRVHMRDAKNYCAILFDNNNRRPICRLHFNRSTKYIGVFDADRNEERFKIEGVDDIFDYSSRLKETVQRYCRAGVKEEVTA